MLRFRSTRTESLGLIESGRLEEAIHRFDTFLAELDRAREDDGDAGRTRIVTAYLDSLPLRDTIATERDRVAAVLEIESEAAIARDAGRNEEAFSLLTKLVRDNPAIGFDGRITLPLRIETAPPGASVLSGDTVIATTPTTVDYLPDGPTDLVVRAPGYAEVVIRRKGGHEDTEHKVELVLDKLPRWRLEPEGHQRSRAVCDRTYAYVAGRNGTIRAVRRDDGTESGRFDSGLIGGFEAAPAASGGVVYAVAVDGQGFVLEGGTLKKVASFSVPGGTRADVLARGSDAIVLDAGGTLHRIDRSGSTRWTVRAGTSTVDPVMTSAGVAVTTRSGEIVLVDADAGTVKYRRALDGAPGCEQPTAFGGVLYAGTSRGEVLAFDLRAGKPLWRVDVPAAARGPVGVTGQVVAYVSSDGSLHLRDRANGEDRGTLPPPDGVRRVHGLIGVDDDLLTVRDDGVVERLTAFGDLVWTFDVGGAVRFATGPTVDASGVLVTTASGAVVELAR